MYIPIEYTKKAILNNEERSFMPYFRSRQRATSRRHVGQCPQTPKVTPLDEPSIRKQSHRPSGLPTTLSLFALCPRGLEAVLAKELSTIGAQRIRIMAGGVAFKGNQSIMMRSNLESRVASRILVCLLQGPYRNERDIYHLARAIPWPRYFSINKTFKVKTSAIDAPVKSLNYLTLLVKDAVCDYFSQDQLRRPNVDTHTPDIRIELFLNADTASIYLDSSGEALFKRGWRQEAGAAPLRENLAAGILLLANYSGTETLLDPMCGSGTFLVEASDIALQRAPGRRRNFSFQQWAAYDEKLWHSLKAAAQNREKPATHLAIYGFDLAESMVELCRRNLIHADVEQYIHLAHSDFCAIQSMADNGMIVSNPPYGVRLNASPPLAKPLIHWLKSAFSGWSAYILSHEDKPLAQALGLVPKQKTALFNGALRCELLEIGL